MDYFSLLLLRHMLFFEVGLSYSIFSVKSEESIAESINPFIILEDSICELCSG